MLEGHGKAQSKHGCGYNQYKRALWLALAVPEGIVVHPQTTESVHDGAQTVYGGRQEVAGMGVHRGMLEGGAAPVQSVTLIVMTMLPGATRAHWSSGAGLSCRA